MKNKATVLSLALIITMTSAAYAQLGMQLVGMAATPGQAFGGADQPQTFGGAEIEITVGDFGIGARHLSRFQEIETALGSDDFWWMDQQSDLFLAYHLFGGTAFLDPFVRYGIGFAGRYDMSRALDYDSASDSYVTASGNDESLERAGIYQYVGLGGQIRLSGLVLGMGVNYNILNQTIGGDIGQYELERFETRVYGGVSYRTGR